MALVLSGCRLAAFTRSRSLIVAFRITGLDVDLFRPLFDLADHELAARGIRREVADDSVPGFPCRVTLAEAEPGERLLLLNFEHQPAPTPYRSAHAIYVRESARETYAAVNRIPAPFLTRPLSIRAFDADGMMVDADVAEGTNAAAEIDRQLADPRVAYLHIHFARRGCYAARVDRA
jgi:hypothetical protein